MAPTAKVQPDFPQISQFLAQFHPDDPHAPNIVPLVASMPAEFLNPSSAYLKLTGARKGEKSFLLESASSRETIARYSFLGCGPRKVLMTGTCPEDSVDPLYGLEAELNKFRVAKIPGITLPPMMGGAIGYVSFDCIRYFEPRTARDLADPLGVPESLFMFYDTIVAFDHFFQLIKVITYVHVNGNTDLEASYNAAVKEVQDVIAILSAPDIPLPPQGPIARNQEYVSNIGREGYESFVHRLKTHITKGDIIQAVPSQRFSRPTTLHPFNIYRHLRTVNPSPYLFYIDCTTFQLVGASPELLVKCEEGRIITHPIAGTVRRGKTSEEDDALAQELVESLKDRAEHVMLVDLARNDINRVCDPLSTTVDRLMSVERFSHVMHLTSQVSGVLRPGMTRFDAFRSIFPAGTVSGAPKIKAMELIAELEKEKRGVYGGSVGYWGYESDSMDQCIALRTMTVKDGVAYLQAGGGIVYDSDPYDEWMETMNKLGANMQCIIGAEERYIAIEEELGLDKAADLKGGSSSGAGGEKGAEVHVGGGL